MTLLGSSGVCVCVFVCLRFFVSALLRFSVSLNLCFLFVCVSVLFCFGVSLFLCVFVSVSPYFFADLFLCAFVFVFLCVS